MGLVQYGWVSDSGQFYMFHAGSRAEWAEWALATQGVLLLVGTRSF